MNDYSKLDYWEDRYSNYEQVELFEWYQIYNAIKDIIAPYLTKESKILNVGAGNSRLSEDLFEDGFTNVTDIDFSPSVVRMMADRYKNLGLPIEYKEANVTDMKEFSDGEFNIVIDKGTLDSILCGENANPLADKMINEIYRVLDKNGVFICISYSNEDSRKVYFTRKDWEYKKEKVAKPTKMIITNVDQGEKDSSKNFHHIYILVKKQKDFENRKNE